MPITTTFYTFIFFYCILLRRSLYV